MDTVAVTQDMPIIMMSTAVHIMERIAAIDKTRGMILDHIQAMTENLTETIVVMNGKEILRIIGNWNGRNAFIDPGIPLDHRFYDTIVR
jgi:hypothetical protein